MGMSDRKPYGFTGNLVNSGLTSGTTSTYTTTAATVHVIGGKYGTALGVQTNTATPTTDVNTSAAFVAVGLNQASVFVFGVNAAGAIKVAQGTVENTYVGTGATAGAFQRYPQFPNLPEDFAPIGYAVLRVAPSGAAWTFGSSNWNATGITVTFTNVMELPDRPQAT